MSIIRKSAPVNVVMHFPETEEGKAELAQRMAEVHADVVIRQIKELNCPRPQKLELVDAIVETVKQRIREQAM